MLRRTAEACRATTRKQHRLKRKVDADLGFGSLLPFSCAANATVEVKEWREEIVFLYRVKMGAADRSYGIHVAKLAGLPTAVLDRADAVLGELEKADGRP